MPQLALLGLLVLAACGASPTSTPAPATVRAAATSVVGTVQGGQTQVVATVQGAQTQAVATVQGGQTQVVATVQGAQTQVVGAAQANQATVAAVATQIAPTIQAARTQIAPTQNALATQIVTAIKSPVAASIAASSAQITAASVSSGPLTVTVVNSGPAPVNLSAWLLVTGAFAATLPGGPVVGTTSVVLPINSNLQIEPGRSVTLHFSPGTDSSTDVYLSALQNPPKSGDTIALVNLAGEVASVYKLA